MSILSLVNPWGWFPNYRAKLSGGQPSSAGPWGSQGSFAGKVATPETAMQIAAFWACVKLIAQTIGTLPLEIYRRKPDGGREVMTDHPLYALLRDQPNADHTAVDFWEGVGACIALWGNAYALKLTLGPRLVAIELLRPMHMAVFRDASGSPVYRYTDPIRRATVDYTADQIFHVRGFGFGELVGLSVIAFARQTVGTSIATDEAVGSTFANGMRPTGWFKYKGGNGILTAEQREQARKVLIEPMSGSGSTGKSGILEGDFDWVAAALPPVDSQMLENRRMNVEDVCRWFGVPPIMIGHASQGQTMWGTGVESLLIGFMTTGLRPYLHRIEAAIAKCLIDPAERRTVYAEFNVDALLRADSISRSKLLSTYVQNGLRTRNEARALDNMPSVDGGDDLTVQSNLLPIHLLGKVSVLPREKPVEDGSAVVDPADQKEPI